MNKLKATLLPLLITLAAVAQDSLSPNLPVPQTDNYKYISIQSNLLLQQFISFNSNSSINTNPYLFSFSRNNTKTGKGLVFGTGFSISENSTNDGVSATTLTKANISMRIGSERKYFQGEKFVPFAGVDYAIGFIYTNTKSRLNQSISNNFTSIEDVKFFMGPALRGGLLYTLSKRILIGSEFFFNFQLAYSRTTTNSGFGNESSLIPINFGFQAPTALFITYRY